jgi:hypothetical protein
VFLSVAVALVGLLWLQHAVAVTSDSARAVLKVAEASDPTKFAVNTGTLVWSIVPAPSAQPSSVGVAAEISIPDLKMHAAIILRRNLISSLPASHIIDIRLAFDADSTISAAKDVALMQMLRDDPAAADALTGFKAKIGESHFLVGLTRGEDDETLNLKMITGRSWFKLLCN